MSSTRSRKALQIFLTILGCTATITGAGTILFGVDSIIGAEAVSPTVDSEMRFFAVWYVGAGLLLLRSVPRIGSEQPTITAITALFFLAGCSRALSWLIVGRPNPVAVGLMVIELGLPLVVLPWQASVARQTRAG